VEKPLGKCPLATPNMRWEGNSKLNVGEMGFHGRWWELAVDHL
jgi:hypothetical protein